MGARTRILWRSPRRFARNRRGSVIVEFALLALPFFMFMFGIIEVGAIFYGDSQLSKATADAARLIRTGQVQAQQMTQAQFHDYICGRIAQLLSCGSNLQVDVEAFSQFGSINIGNPIDGNGNLNGNLNNYKIGQGGDIVLVRTFYTWDILTPLLRPFFADLSNGKRLLTSTAAFRNEPFR